MRFQLPGQSHGRVRGGKNHRVHIKEVRIKIMNSIESLKDYLIADEITRIESLSREALVRELVAVRSEQIESLNDVKSIRKYAKEKQRA